MSTSDQGMVESDEVLNVNQWRAIQRFGGGKVAVEKARKVAMQRLKQLTGEDVVYEYMFAVPEAPPLPPSAVVDPLMLDPSRDSPHQPRRVPPSAAMRARSPSPERPESSTATTGSSSPPHGRQLRPQSFARERVPHLPHYSSPPPSQPQRSGSGRLAASLSKEQGSTRIAEALSPSETDTLSNSHHQANLEGKTGSGGGSGRSLGMKLAAPQPSRSPPPRRRQPRSPTRSGRAQSSSPPWGGSGIFHKDKDSGKDENRASQRRSLSPPGTYYQGHALRRSQAREDNKAKKSAREEEFHKRWRAGLADPNYPPWKHSQPQSDGKLYPVEIKVFNFDEAHPAVAHEHFKRSNEQNHILVAEAERAAKQARKLAIRVEREQALRSVSNSGSRVTSFAGSKPASKAASPYDGLSRVNSTAGAASGHVEKKDIHKLSTELLEAKLEAIKEENTDEAKRRSSRARARHALTSATAQSHAGTKYSGTTFGAPPPPRLVARAKSAPRQRGSLLPAPSSPPPGARSSPERWEISRMQHKVEALQAGISSQRESLSPAQQRQRSSGSFEFPHQTTGAGEMNQAAVDRRSLADHTAEMSNTWSASISSTGGKGAWQQLTRRRQGSSMATSETVPGGEMEVMVAAGKFDSQRFGDYQAAMDEVMEERMHRGMRDGDIEHGYESDLDREQERLEAARALEEAQREAELQRFPERRGTGDLGKSPELVEEWAQQNEWMDEYRKGVAENNCYEAAGGSRENASAGTAALSPTCQPAEGRALDRQQSDEVSSPSTPVYQPWHLRHPHPYPHDHAHANREGSPSQPGSHHRSNRPRNILSVDDLALINSEYIPFVQSEFPVYAIAEDRRTKSVDGEGRLSAVYTYEYPAHYYSEGEDQYGTIYWPVATRRPHKSQRRTKRFTVPEPFRFEHHQSLPSQYIMSAKLDAELALKKQEHHSACNARFHARPLPSSIMEPRYAIMNAEQEMVRQSNKEASRQWHKALEQPFSFYFTDQLRQQIRKDTSKKLNDPNRFQKQFRAKEPPQHTFQDRWKMLQDEMEAKKHDRVARAEQKLSESRMPNRMEQAQIDAAVGDSRRRRQQQRRERVHPDWQTKYPSRPLGYVPNFDELHANFEFEAAKTRARVRRGATVPEEFKLTGNRKEDTARRIQGLENKKKVVVDILIDQDELPETRWPYITPRARVPPSYLPATRPRVAASPRKTGTAKQSHGDITRKAKEHVEAKRQASRANRSALMDDTMASGSHVAADSSQCLDEEVAQPSLYRQAKKKQAEQRAKEEVQDVLLAQSINALRYFEEEDVTA